MIQRYFTIVGLLLLTSCYHSPQMKGPGPGNTHSSLKAFTVLESLPTLNVYTADNSAVNVSYASERAKLFGITAAAVDTGKVYRASSGDLEVQVDKVSGATFFQDRHRMWGADDQPFTTPLSDDEAEALAVNYIAARRLAKRSELHFFQVNRLKRVSSVTNVQETMEVEVVFKRKLHGRLVHGAGSQLSLFIGSDKQVRGVFLDWPDLKKQHEVPLRDSRKAAGDLKKALDEVNKRFKGEIKVKGFDVKTTRLEYAGRISPDGKRTVYPVYTLEGIKHIGDKQEVDVLVVPATDDLHLPSPTVGTSLPTQLPGPTPQEIEN